MPVRPSPTVRRRRLRSEMRRLREERGLTIEDVSKASDGDISESAISRWENGDRGLRPTELRILLDIYKVEGEEREALLTLCRQARARGWWHTYGDAVPDWFKTYVGLETEARSIHVYEAELVDGLLQTADYARAIMRTAPAGVSDEEAERQVALRQARQERLISEEPPAYWAVLNEAVIRRVVGGAEVMRAQLRHIAEVSELTHVNIQVLPFRAGEHAAMVGAFRILAFPEVSDPKVVFQESQMGGLYHERLEDVDRYKLMFDHLIAKALDPGESRRLIARAVAELG